VNIGILFPKEGNLKEARTWFERAAKLRDGDANLEITKIYLGKNKKPKAIRYLRETRKADYVTENSEQEAEDTLRQLGVRFGRRRKRSWR